jgi:tape measure domain-containing protein|nr:MAG TPA: Tape measure domain protein [Caudoviricetes sp.]
MAEDIDGALGIRATIDADDVKRGADEFIDALMRMQMQANNAAKTISSDVSLMTSNLSKSDEGMSKQANNAAKTSAEIKNLGNSYSQASSKGENLVSTLYKMQDAGATADAMFASLAKSAASFGVAFSAQEFASHVTNIRGQFQQIEMAFNTMLGSEQKASALMQQMVNTAASTPFDLQGVANGAKQLLAYGLEANKVNGTLVRLGDIAAGLSIPLNDIIYLYGTTMSQGRLYAQDLMQFTGRGIPMIAELAKQFGVSESKVKDLVSEGKVGFPEVQKAIEDLTNEGGKFGGLMEAQSKTLTGQLANLEDNIDMMFNEIGEKSEGAIGGAIELAADMVDHYKEIGSVIISIAAAWGMNKAATAAVAAVNNAAASQEIANLEQEIALIQQKNGISALDNDLGQQVEGGSIDLNKANQIQELRNQLKALHEEEVQAAQDAFDTANKAWEEAQSSFASASAGVEDAKNVVDATNEQIDAINEKIAVAFNEGDAEAFAAGEAELAAATKQREAAADNLSTASKAKETAATNVQAAATAKNTAATNLSSVSKKAQVVQQNIDTASKSANSLATKALTWATGQLTTAFNGLKAAFASNPIGMALTAISIGIGIFSAFSDSTEEATEDVKRFGEEAVKTQSNATTLLAVVNSVDKNSKVYKDSIEELCGIYDEYGIKIDEEKDKLSQVNQFRAELIKLIQQEGQARINANALESYNKSIEKESKDLKDKLQESFSSGWDAIDKDAMHRDFAPGEEMYEANIKVGEQWKKFSEMSEQASVVATSIITSYASKWKEANGNVSEQNKLLSQMYSSFKGQMGNMGVDITYLKTGFSDYAKSGLNNIAMLMTAQAQYAKKVQEDSDRAAAKQNANNDITKMSVEDLIKKYNEASTSVSDLGDKEAKPKVDSSDAEKATEEHDKASNASDNLDKKKAKPKVDASDADIAKTKVNTLSSLLAKLSGTQWYVKIKSIFDRNAPSKGNKPQKTNGLFSNFPSNNNLPWNKPKQPYNGPFITPQAKQNAHQPQKKTSKKQTTKASQNSQKEYLNQIKKRYTDQIENAHSNDAIDAIVKDLKAQVNAADDRTDLRKMLVGLKAKAQDKQKRLNKSAGNETGGGKKSGKKGTTRTKSAAEIKSDRISIQKDAKEKEGNEIAKMQQEITDDSIKYMDESLNKEIKEIENNKNKEEKALEDWLNAIIKNRKSVSEKLWKAGNHKKGETWQNTKDGKKTDAQWRDEVLSDTNISAVYNKRKSQIVDNASKDKATAIKEHFAEYDSLSDKEKQMKKLRADIQFLEKELQKATDEASKNEIEKLRKNAQAQLDWVSQSKDAWNDYYEKYGTFLEKRKALGEKFMYETTGLDQDSAQYKLKVEEFKAANKALEFEEVKKQLNWEDVFGDLSSLSKSALAELQSQLETLIKNDKNLSIESIKAINEAINKVRDEQTKKGSLIGGLFTSVRNLKEKSQAAKTAQAQVQRVGGGSLWKRYQNASSAEEKAEIRAEKVYDPVSGELKTFGDMLDKAAKSTKDLSDAQKTAQSSIKSVGSGFTAMSSMGKDVSNMLEKFGVTMPEGLGTMFDGIGEIGSAFDGFDLTKIGSFLDIGNYVHAITGVFSGIADVFSGMFKMIFGKSDSLKAYENERKHYEKLSGIWSDLIEKKKQYVEMSFGDGAKEAIKEVEALYKAEEKSLEALATKYLQVRNTGAHSYGYRIDRDLGTKGLQAMSQAAGVQINSVSDLTNLSYDQLVAAKGADNGEYWAKLPVEMQDYLDKLIECKKATQDFQEDTKEKMTGIKFDDMYSNFMSVLEDMNSGADDFANSVKDKMRKALIDNTMGKAVEEWTKDFTERYQKQVEADGGKLTEEHARQFQQELEEASNNFTNQRNDTLNNSGLGGEASDGSQTKGFAAASESSIEELSGRALAQTEALYQIRDNQLIDTLKYDKINDSLCQMINIERGRNEYYDTSIEIQRTSVSHLAAIEKNTNELYSMNERLAKIEKNTRNI